MAQRLTHGTVHVRRGPGRPRKGAKTAAAVQEALGAPPGMGGNVSDETRVAFLERGQEALLVLEERKQLLRSARGVFSAIIKDAKSAGAGQIAWALKQMRRDPLDITTEIVERNAMLRVAKIPVGIQLELEITGAWMAPLRAR